MANTKNQSWSANVAKSMGRASKSVFKKYAPTLSGTMDSVNEMIKDMRKQSSKMSRLNRQQMKEIEKTPLARNAKSVFDRAMSDIKSGNFSREIADDMFDTFDSDISMDFDIDMEEAESLSSDELAMQGSKGIANTIMTAGVAQMQNMENMTKMIMGSNLKSNKILSDSILSGITHSTNLLNRSLLSINDKLDSVNSNLVSILDFQNNNTTRIYEAFEDFSSKTIAMMDSMGEMMSKMDEYNNGKSIKDPRTFDVRDGFNIKEYIKYAKKGLRDSTPFSLGGMIGGMFLQELKEDPLKFIAESVVTAAIPKSLKSSVSKADKNLQKYIGEILFRIGDIDPGRNNMGLAMLGLSSIFKGLGNDRISKKGSLNTGAYEKGALQWNGIAQKALVEVIPEYLSNIDNNIDHISKMLTGNNTVNSSGIRYTNDRKKYYDYELGKFKTKKKISDDFLEELKSNYADFEYQDILQQVLSKVPESKRKDFKKDLNKILNDKIKNNSTDREFTDNLNELFYFLKSEDYALFKDVMMASKTTLQDKHKINNQMVRDIGTTQSVYRNVNNKYGRNSKGEKYSLYDRYSGFSDKDIIDFFDLDVSVERKSVKDLIEEAFVMLNLNFDSLTDERRFKASILRDKSFIDNCMDGSYSESEIRDYIANEYQRTFGSTNLLDRITKKFSSKVSRALGFDDKVANINSKIKAFDNYAFEKSFGLKDIDGYVNKYGETRPTSNPSPSHPVLLLPSPISDPHIKKNNNGKASSVHTLKMNKSKFKNGGKIKYLDDLGKIAGSINIDKDSKMQDSKITNSQNIISKAMGELSKDSENQPTTIEESIIQSNNLVTASVGAMMGTFRNFSMKLIGNTGFFSKFFDEQIKVKIAENAHKTLFDEDRGIFREEVTGAKDKIRNFGRRVKSSFKRGYRKVYDSTSKYLFGEDFRENETWQKYGRWASPHKKDREEEQVKKSLVQNFKAGAKKYAPSVAAAGIVGAILGGPLVSGTALLLPHTFIGGAMAASGLAILSKTEAMKQLVFGKLDEKTGERSGGLINKNLAEKMKKAAPYVIGGATFGILKKLLLPGLSLSLGGPFGLLGGALFGNGIIGAALVGAGLGIAKNSDSVQKILFGDIDPSTGKRSGGPVNKIMKSLNEVFQWAKPKLGAGIKGLGIGALTGLTMSGMGVIPAALSAGGPIGMGLVGFGLGLMSTSDKFQRWLFGDEILDKDGNPTGKRTSGLLARATNMVKVNFVDKIGDTFKNNLVLMLDWMKEKLMIPFRAAFGPILDSILGIKENIVDFVKEKFESITDGIKSMLESTFKKILSPINKLVRATIGISGALVRHALQLKMLPLAIGLKGLQFLTSPKRAKEKFAYGLDYFKTLPAMLEGKWEIDKQFGKEHTPLSQFVDVVKAVTGHGELANAARAGYNEASGKMGYNHLNWRSTPEDLKEIVKTRKKHVKDIKMWNRVDAITRDLAKQLGYRDNIELTDADFIMTKNRLAKAGLDVSTIKDSSDIMNLLYRKGDFKKDLELRQKNRSIEEIATQEGIKINESKEEKEYRKNSLSHQVLMNEYLSRIEEVFSDKAFIHHMVKKGSKWGDDPERERRFINTMSKKAKAKGIKINALDFRSLTNLDEDLIDDELFDKYRKSIYYSTGDFEKFTKSLQSDRNKEKISDIKLREEFIKNTLGKNATEQKDIEEQINEIKDIALETLGLNKNKFNLDKALDSAKDDETSALHQVAIEICELVKKQNNLAEESNKLEEESVQNLQAIKNIEDSDIQIKTEGKLNTVKLRNGLKGAKLSKKDLDNFAITEEEQEEKRKLNIADLFFNRDKLAEEKRIRDGAKPLSFFGKIKEGGKKAWNSKALEKPKSILGDIFGGLFDLGKAGLASKPGQGLLKFAKLYAILSGVLGVGEALRPGMNQSLIDTSNKLGMDIEENNIWDKYIIPNIEKLFSSIGDFIGKIPTLLDKYWDPVIIPAITGFTSGLANSVPRMVQVMEIVVRNTVPAIVEAGMKVLPQVFIGVFKGIWNASVGRLIPKFRLGNDAEGNTKIGAARSTTQDLSDMEENERDAYVDKLKSDPNIVAYYDKKNKKITTSSAQNVVGYDEETGTYLTTDSSTGTEALFRGLRNASLDVVRTNLADKGLIKASMFSRLAGKTAAGSYRSWGRGLLKGTGSVLGSMVGAAGGATAGAIKGDFIGSGAGLVAGARKGYQFTNELIDGKAIQKVGEATKGARSAIGKVLAKGKNKKFVESAFTRYSGIIRQSDNTTKAFNKVIKEADASLIDFIAKMITKSSDELADPKHLQQLTKILGDEKMAVKVMDAIKDMCMLVGKSLKSEIAKNPKVGNAILKKMTGKLLNGAAKAIPLINVAFMLADAISGFAEAARLFGVSEDAVDGKMRTVSTIMKFVLGLGPMVFIDIGFEISKAISKVDIKQKIAMKIYEILCFGDMEKMEKLKAKQASLTADLADFNATMNASMTKEDWNAMKNRTLGRKILNAVGIRSKAEKKFDSQLKEYNRLKNENQSYKSTNPEEYKKLVNSNSDYRNNPYTNPSETGTYNTYDTSIDKPLGGGKGKSVGYGNVDNKPNSQKNKKWASIPIGRMPDGSVSTMANGGCGPTALSMVANTVQPGITPGQMGLYASNNGYISQGGANGRLFTEGAARLGLKPTVLKNSDGVIDSLIQNKPTIIAGKGGESTPFTKAGHIVVGRGFRNGKIVIEDPDDGSTKLYNTSILNKSTGGWAYGYGKASSKVDTSKYEDARKYSGEEISIYRRYTSTNLSSKRFGRGFAENIRNHKTLKLSLPKDINTPQFTPVNPKNCKNGAGPNGITLIPNKYRKTPDDFKDDSKAENSIIRRKLTKILVMTNKDMYKKWKDSIQTWKRYKRFLKNAIKDWGKAVDKVLRHKKIDDAINNPQSQSTSGGRNRAGTSNSSIKNMTYEEYLKYKKKSPYTKGDKEFYNGWSNDDFFKSRFIIEHILIEHAIEDSKMSFSNLTENEIEKKLAKLKKELGEEYYNDIEQLAKDTWAQENPEESQNGGTAPPAYIYNFIMENKHKSHSQIKDELSTIARPNTDYNDGASSIMNHDKEGVLEYLRNKQYSSPLEALQTYIAAAKGLTQGFLTGKDKWDLAAKELEELHLAELAESGIDIYYEEGAYRVDKSVEPTINSKKIKIPKELKNMSANDFADLPIKKRIELMKKFSQTLGKAASIPPSLIPTVGILESGLGNGYKNNSKSLAKNNLYGIMKPGTQTLESYSSVGDSMLAFAKVMQNDYYTGVRDALVPGDAFKALAQSPYCAPNEGETDIQKAGRYQNTLFSIYKNTDYDLASFDNIKGWGDGPTFQSSFLNALTGIGERIGEKSLFGNMLTRPKENKSKSKSNKREDIPTNTMTVASNNAADWIYKSLPGSRISSPFGNRPDPFGSGKTVFHNGMDFAIKKGTPIYSPVSGTVTNSYFHKLYGELTTIKDSKGAEHYFAHESKRYRTKGDTISKGDIVGLVGSTGNSTGPHLHYGVKTGKNFVNPKSYSLPSGYGKGGTMLDKYGRVNTKDLDLTTINALKKYDILDSEAYYGSAIGQGPRAIINSINNRGVEEKLDIITGVLTEWKKDGVGNNINIVNSGNNTSTHISGKDVSTQTAMKPVHPSKIKNDRLVKMHAILSAI